MPIDYISLFEPYIVLAIILLAMYLPERKSKHGRKGRNTW